MRFFKSSLASSIGVVVFLVTIKLVNINLLSLNLPLFQMLISAFALISLGVFYTDEEKKINPAIFLCFEISIIIISCFYYVVISNEWNYVFFYSTLATLTFFNFFSYICIINGEFDKFLNCLIFGSVALPFNLFIDNGVLSTSFAVIIFIFTNLTIVKEINSKWGVYKNFRIISLSPVISLFGQSLILGYGLCDVYLPNMLGKNEYLEYVFSFKIIYGIVCLLFSYAQNSIIFSKNGDKLNKYFFLMSTILLFALVPGIVTKERELLLVSLTSFSILLNISALNIRNIIKLGIGSNRLFFSPLFLFLYWVYCFVLSSQKIGGYYFILIISFELVVLNLIIHQIKMHDVIDKHVFTG